MTRTPETIIQTLRTEQQVLKQGNRLILRRYERWYYITMTMDSNQISAVNFMSEKRITSMVREWTANARLLTVKEISPNFQSELNEKVLLNADSYRPLLKNGRCHLVGGYTTDTLHTVDADLDTQIHTIQSRMDGKPGPYLSFR